MKDNQSVKGYRAQVLRTAYEEAGADEDEHPKSSLGGGREPWIQFLGIESGAVAAEEGRGSKRAIGVAGAKLT